MNFNTQVCTTREQSERLLALGLKKDTADMYLTRRFVGNNGTPMIFIGTTHKPSTVLFSKEDIPAWSLHRLVALCPIEIENIVGNDKILFSINQIGAYFDDWSGTLKFFESKDTLFDNLIDCIEWLINNNHFNKQYLNQKL